MSGDPFNFEDFDSIFNDEPAKEIDYEFESEKLLRGLENNLEAVQKEFDDGKTESQEIDIEERQLRIKLNELTKRKAKIQDTAYEFRRKVFKIKSEVEDQRQKVDIDRENKKHKEKLTRERTSLLEDTADCAWVEDAMDFQIDGAVYAAIAKRCVIADSMGLGKTLESIIYCSMVDSRRTLVACPGEVMSGFRDSFKRWAPERLVRILGKKSKDEQRIILDMTKDNGIEEGSKPLVIIINYESWARNKALLEWIKDAKFDTVIVDESHRMKEVNKQTAQGIFNIVNNTDPIIPNVLCMTGTPILNKPEDIYSNLKLIAPELFAEKARFKRNFCDFTGEGWGPGGQERLAQAISGMYIRRKLSDTGITLPPQEHFVHEIELDAEEYELQTEIMDMLWNDAQVKAGDDTISVPGLLALITRQRQATVWPGGIWMNVEQYDAEGLPKFVYDDKKEDYVQETLRVHVGKDYQQSVKIDKAVELFNELTDSGIRVAIFSQFKEALKEMGRRLDGRAVEFTGDTRDKDREEIKRNFDVSYGEEPKWEGILCHYVTGGVGLNLTGAQAIIILDEEWNDGKNQQAYDRIHRIGQTQNTQVHILRHVGPGPSIDQWLANMIAFKANLVNGFNMSVEQLAGAFDMNNQGEEAA